MNTLPPPRADNGRGGPSRPSRPATSAVVVARDSAIREDWARALEAVGMTVTRCAGPTVECVLLRGRDRCPLLDEAGIALYHDAGLSGEFLERLNGADCRAMTIATRDRRRFDGSHEPAMSHVIAPPGG